MQQVPIFGVIQYHCTKKGLGEWPGNVSCDMKYSIYITTSKLVLIKPVEAAKFQGKLQPRYKWNVGRIINV